MQRTTLLGLVGVATTLLVADPFALSAQGCDDSDGDGVCAEDDNCTEVPNATQTDTDGDLCGNRCDADIDQSGTTGLADFGQLASVWGTAGTGGPPGEEDIGEDPPSGTIGITDFGEMANRWGTQPGPSGTSPGTAFCSAAPWSRKERYRHAGSPGPGQAQPG